MATGVRGWWQRVVLPRLPGWLAARLGRPREPAWQRGLRLARRLGLLLLSLALFVFALQLMKEGAREAAPLLRDSLRLTNPVNALGAGWLFAYVVMSGSPVAAAALTFLAHQAIEPVEAYAMIAGSRLGASLIVLVIGFLYVLRGHERRGGLTTGLLSLVTTASIYLPALLLGYAVLQAGWLSGLQFRVGVVDLIDQLYGPAVEGLSSRLPALAIFGLGMVAVVASFSLFDRGLPPVRLRGRGFEQAARLVYRPVVMFLLGLAITTVSLSVSVSLGVLVPLSARGLVRRENVIPYIMGCNVSTFVDTLAVAVLLGSAEGLTVVLVEMLSVAAVSVVVLVSGFRLYERAVVRVVEWSLGSNRNLGLFMAALLLVPLTLVLL